MALPSPCPEVELPVHEKQGIAFHLMQRCEDQTAAFQNCMKTSAKPSQQCKEEYVALQSCAKKLVEEAVQNAKEEWKHYTHCLELVGGKYAYCRPEKSKFDEAFPLQT